MMDVATWVYYSSSRQTDTQPPDDLPLFQLLGDNEYMSVRERWIQCLRTYTPAIFPNSSRPADLLGKMVLLNEILRFGNALLRVRHIGTGQNHASFRSYMILSEALPPQNWRELFKPIWTVEARRKDNLVAIYGLLSNAQAEMFT